MQDMATFRTRQFEMMKNNPALIQQILASITDGAIYDKRDGGDGWTISEVLGHILDYEGIFHERVILTVENDNPTLPAPDQNQLVIDRGYVNQSAIDILGQWQAKREEFLQYLTSLSEDDAIWERPAIHPRRGTMPINEQLYHVAWHDNIHSRQIVNIIHS